MHATYRKKVGFQLRSVATIFTHKHVLWTPIKKVALTVFQFESQSDSLCLHSHNNSTRIKGRAGGQVSALVHWRWLLDRWQTPPAAPPHSPFIHLFDHHIDTLFSLWSFVIVYVIVSIILLLFCLHAFYFFSFLLL